MFSKRPSEIRQWFKVAPQGFLTARGLGANIARTLKVSTCKHGDSIRSHDCYLKRYNKNIFTQYNFYVMESRVSSNCTRNIHRPSTSEREVNQKENAGKDCVKATESKVYACSDTDRGEVLFHYVMLCDKGDKDLSSKIYRFSCGEIS